MSKLFAIEKYKRVANNKIEKIVSILDFESVSVVFIIETF